MACGVVASARYCVAALDDVAEPPVLFSLQVPSFSVLPLGLELQVAANEATSFLLHLYYLQA